MRNLLRFGVATGAALTAIGLAGAGVAEPAVRIEHAVAQVTVIPEDRSDVEVTITRTNSHYPLRVTREGDQVLVDGDLTFSSAYCHNNLLGKTRVSVFGRPSVDIGTMPAVVVHTPRMAVVRAGGAVFGAVGRGAGLDLANSGCGDWTVANQSGPLHADISGSGNLHAGDAAEVALRVAGSADTWLHAAHGGLQSHISGSGDVHADEVDGPLTVYVSGSGDVRVRGGSVGTMDVAIAGSGDVNFGGVAQSLNARVAGSGDVHVAQVTGEVTRRVAGSGDVVVGH